MNLQRAAQLTLQPKEKTGAEGRSAEVASDEEDGDAELELQTEGDIYVIEFPHESKLGMLLEKSEEVRGCKVVERTIVKMVIDGGAADTRGVKLGSKIVKVNGNNVVGADYLTTLDQVRNLPRPLTVEFESVGHVEDTSQGYCIVRKAPGYKAPPALHMWNKAYFVIGGAVAKPHVLQIYDSKLEYEQVVVNMFQNTPIKGIRYKAYNLTSNFRVSGIHKKSYRLSKKNVHFVTLKNPKSKTKVLKIGSHEDPNVVVQLQNRLQMYCKG